MDDEDDESEPKRTSGKLWLLVALALAVGGAGGGYFALPYLMPSDHAASAGQDHAASPVHGSDAASDVAFVEVPTMVVTLGGLTGPRLLRFSANLEVAAGAESEVSRMLPRVTDALNSFLQAVDEADLADRDALFRLRAQMLHRARLVAGEANVRDLLIAEFVLN